MSEQTSAGTTAYTRDPSGNIVSARSGSNRLYYALDSIGSVVGVFDASGGYTGGYSYDPYGKLRSATNSSTITANSIRFTGGYWDSAVNLYRLGARYYDPSTGRFTQADPSGQERNPYSYGNCNPTNGSDLTGLKFDCSLQGQVGFVSSTTTIGGAAGGALGLGVGAIGFAAGPPGRLDSGPSRSPAESERSSAARSASAPDSEP